MKGLSTPFDIDDIELLAKCSGIALNVKYNAFILFHKNRFLKNPYDVMSAPLIMCPTINRRICPGVRASEEVSKK